MAAVIELNAHKDRAVLHRVAELYERDEVEESFELINQFLLDEPNDAQAIVLCAGILKKARKFPLAYNMAQRAVQMRPDKCETWGTLAHCAHLMWRMEEAWSGYKKALDRSRTDEQKALYESNLASVLVDTGRFTEAEARIRKALALMPDDPHARHNLGLSLLAQRRWTEGWPYYSASMGTAAGRTTVKYRNPAEPVWDGSKGMSIVVTGEQGLGDEICAASMLPAVIADCRKVIVDCDKRLEGLFKRSFPQASVYGTRWAKPGDGKWKETSADIEASISGFEVGKFYRNADADFPGTPYLTACPERSAMWQARFAQIAKPVIGIAWTGGIRQNASLERRLPLSEWAPIFQSVDAHWVSLQYKNAAEDIVGTPVQQYPWATLTKDYDDTAALVNACDLILCMQTTVGHLAGALGKPVWMMVPKTSQWRYGEGHTSIPWYRSMKLYRQKDTWGPLVKQIAEDLRAHF